MFFGGVGFGGEEGVGCFLDAFERSKLKTKQMQIYPIWKGSCLSSPSPTSNSLWCCLCLTEHVHLYLFSIANKMANLCLMDRWHPSPKALCSFFTEASDNLGISATFSKNLEQLYCSSRQAQTILPAFLQMETIKQNGTNRGVHIRQGSAGHWYWTVFSSVTCGNTIHF